MLLEVILKLDPVKKEFSISHAKLTSFDENIKKELDKCALVCANCHREIHAGVLDLSSHERN